MSQQLSTNTFGCAKWIVDPISSQGTHTTIPAALTSASSGDTIFIRPGTYTENLTLKAGVNLTAYTCDAFTPNVTISGTCTLTAAGTVSISGIRLQTNSAALLAVTGSAASIINLDNCYLNCSNATGISFTSSSSSAAINITNCKANLGTTGIGFFTHSSSGALTFYSCQLSNGGGSTTASTCSAGVLNANNSIFGNPITFSSTGQGTFVCCTFSTLAQNVTCVTCGGGANEKFLYCYFLSGTASAVSISTNGQLEYCDINSSNTNAITGAGQLNYWALTFSGSSSKINTTTQVGGTLQGGLTQAPSAGFLGQSISSTATSVATTSTVSKTITSIALTPGIWDISAMAAATATGGTAVMTAMIGGISTTDNAFSGTLGLEHLQIGSLVTSSVVLSVSVPQYRVTLTANTTYYLVVANFYTSTTCPTNGRISATRVG